MRITVVLPRQGARDFLPCSVDNKLEKCVQEDAKYCNLLIRRQTNYCASQQPRSCSSVFEFSFHQNKDIQTKNTFIDIVLLLFKKGLSLFLLKPLIS